MIKFQSIDQFRHTLKNVAFKAQFKGLDNAGEPVMDRLAALPKIVYEGTTKIHGKCLSVCAQGEKITCQSRNNEISIENDCYGFARFIADLPKEAIIELKKLFGDNVVIFGEWAGKGIQDTVAVCQLEKFWSIFRVQKINEDEEKSEWIDLSDKDLAGLNQYKIYSIRQFGVEMVEIDFEKPAESINKLNELSLAVEKECPAGKFFGISGIGEGRVFTPKDKEYWNSKFVFKVKGSEHSKSKVTKLANVDVEKLKSIEDFVDKHLSDGRLQQGYDWLKETGKPQDEKSTGDFIRWVFNDLIKEEADELEGSGLTTKDLGGVLNKRAKKWFFEKIGI